MYFTLSLIAALCGVLARTFLAALALLFADVVDANAFLRNFMYELTPLGCAVRGLIWRVLRLRQLISLPSSTLSSILTIYLSKQIYMLQVKLVLPAKIFRQINLYKGIRLVLDLRRLNCAEDSRKRRDRCDGAVGSKSLQHQSHYFGAQCFASRAIKSC